MKIPSKEECFRLMAAMETMDHIAHHSFQVCRVALFLTDSLAARHIFLNRDLIEASARLHDITKTRSIRTGERHADTAAKLMTDLDYPEVGDIIRQHVRVDNYSAVTPISEAEIVNYADKRVLHTEVVGLEQRMSYILERYGKTPQNREYIMENWKQTRELEEKIFRVLDFPVEQLAEKLGADDSFEEYLKSRIKGSADL
jgi:putative nucleotidyltransferase with HDIG domain